MNLNSITKMPAGSKSIHFDTCTGCPDCCNANNNFIEPITNACVECSLDATFNVNGIARKGGSGTSFVSCITGNADAPIGNQALFVGAEFQPTFNTYGVELTFDQPVTFFGFSAVATASTSEPKILVEGYSEDGVLVGTDSFDFSGWAAGTCEVSNPAARFFGFRACCGKMKSVVVSFSDPNAAMDTLTFQ